LIKQDDSPEASLPTQAVECGRQDVFGSGMVVDYNQVFEHARIVRKAARPIVTSLSSITKEYGALVAREWYAISWVERFADCGLLNADCQA